MYTVVLLAAMTSGEATPAHGWRRNYLYGACYGACYGVCYAGYEGYVNAAGCWGQPYGGYYAGYANYGGCSYDKMANGGFPSYMQPPTMGGPPEKKVDNGPGKVIEKKREGEKIDDEEQPRAQVIFALPPGAKLFVDDKPITNIDTRKQFRTPVLQRGEEYYYELRAEIIHEGKLISEKKRVTLSAGEVIKADFSKLGKTTGVAKE